ncbi:putative dipeptidyl-aminopeptidase B [Pseudovirgaria hyperparasitica]|uniref:dipeptidyl-peptidase IV n=1 Tax=Pseudovirgaria hyperparasitica TaxID=470096 RepID=A0A6A6W1B0_9PEZI|nr:putative dipeptidyl-aminopeptidase B [Pseudovirgaria hyperparasitica]KAF2756708.1 putative dipeptidyl-aminopeptidase B [Pseudovirgaria hyperparasitica]
MAPKERLIQDETEPLTNDDIESRSSLDDGCLSFSSASTTSLILEHINDQTNMPKAKTEGSRYRDEDGTSPHKEEIDVEEGRGYYGTSKPVDKKARSVLWMLGVVCLVGWALALLMFVWGGSYKHSSTRPHDPLATASRGSGKKVTLDEVQGGAWRAKKKGISWIAGAQGEDGYVLEESIPGKPFLVVEDVKNIGMKEVSDKGKVLMKQGGFMVGEKWVYPNDLWPSPDLTKVLIMSDREKNWRHSSQGLFWIFDVEKQSGEPVDPSTPDQKMQLVSWSPQSDALVFTRENNMYIRKLTGPSDIPIQITQDGGPELFYGVPDWVYEEEVFSGNSATWWSEDGEYVAFLRTNESAVPTFPVQYFLSRPSGHNPPEGLENYPEVRDIKYPKAGAPNPIVNMQFYDVAKNEVFSVNITEDFADDTRLITEVVWAGRTKQVLVRETNRESDLLKLVLIDVVGRSGKTIRTQDINALDGGWMEVSQDTTFIPADPKNGREHDGYIDTVVHDGYDHLGYFTPLDNPDPILLTSGDWEVVDAPSAVDLKNNFVYFVSTQVSSMERHVYRVKFDGTGLAAITDTGKEGYYEVSFSKGAGYALLSYDGPNIPWQKIINTPSNEDSLELKIESNEDLEKLARSHELPLLVYSSVAVDDVEVNVLERRPAHFDKKRKYPVLFQQYSGPGSQSVHKKFAVDFQSYVASSLGYIVVTVDPRGTGFKGRKFRCITRGDLGQWEAHDHIAVAKEFAKRKYIDEDRIAMWGWSYGGFQTLKTLEVDAGETFHYGMAVAPVVDWRFYDSIYTERYMHTPQNNAQGFDNSSIHNPEALGQNIRFLVMHGASDDNVHLQNTLTLLDKLDMKGVENYDVHFFPDSDHSIYFHNANRMVYDKLSNWLVNAFNGEWLKVDQPVPKAQIDARVRLR